MVKHGQCSESAETPAARMTEYALLKYITQ